ncbi:MAG: GGDEF domain-containing protein [Mailhella sp.]|nr:GGDEF domain-containing protein [Mailhella sp.]
MEQENDFKHINDTYGHHIGDKLLIEFANRISRCLVPEEFAARLGGDEFLAVFYCKKPDDDSMPARLQGIQNYLQQPYLLDGMSCLMTVSIGYVSPDKNVLQNKPRQQTDEEFFIDLADKVMYHNKKKYHQNKENRNTEKNGGSNRQSISI